MDFDRISATGDDDFFAFISIMSPRTAANAPDGQVLQALAGSGPKSFIYNSGDVMAGNQDRRDSTSTDRCGDGHEPGPIVCFWTDHFVCGR
jgi:hypothetical protein